MGKRELSVLKPPVHKEGAVEDGSTFTNGYTWSSFCEEWQEHLQSYRRGHT